MNRPPIITGATADSVSIATKLDELAERCEAATVPSYALDCAIWDHIYPGERDERFAKLTAKGQPYAGRLGSADRDGYVQPLRAFTASLDAAMTLVPEGYRLSTLSSESMAVMWKASIWLMDGWAEMPQPPCGSGATPALALCAAALRARAAQ